VREPIVNRQSSIVNPQSPRRAASAILLREGPGGGEFEVFMLRRPADARFAPNMHSFPGGMLDAEDVEGAARLALPRPGGITPDDLHARMGGDGPFASPDAATSAALLYCAARETFEETGVLVARDGAGQPATLADQAHWATSRDEVLAGTLLFDRLLSASGLTIALDDLIYFSHWITPESSPLRFDTHFFLATLPPGQVATHWPGEMADGEWLTPRAGLARHEAGRMPMFPVQVQHLARFARFDSLAALLEYARTKPVHAVVPVIGPHGRELALPKELAECW
jgi:8-oxo-dGTP pyrophosphatase MutT (NUDIX family)